MSTQTIKATTNILIMSKQQTLVMTAKLLTNELVLVLDCFCTGIRTNKDIFISPITLILTYLMMCYQWIL